jgi:hypothetical protein
LIPSRDMILTRFRTRTSRFERTEKLLSLLQLIDDSNR